MSQKKNFLLLFLAALSGEHFAEKERRSSLEAETTKTRRIKHK